MTSTQLMKVEGGVTYIFTHQLGTHQHHNMETRTLGTKIIRCAGNVQASYRKIMMEIMLIRKINLRNDGNWRTPPKDGRFPSFLI